MPILLITAMLQDRAAFAWNTVGFAKYQNIVSEPCSRAAWLVMCAYAFPPCKAFVAPPISQATRTSMRVCPHSLPFVHSPTCVMLTLHNATPRLQNARLVSDSQYVRRCVCKR